MMKSHKRSLIRLLRKKPLKVEQGGALEAGFVLIALLRMSMEDTIVKSVVYH